MTELKGKVKDVAEELKLGSEPASIAAKLGLTMSTVKTYISKVRKALDLSATNAPSSNKQTVPEKVQKPKSFSEMVARVNSLTTIPESLEERVAYTKKLYCNLCPYEGKSCNECPTKVIFEKVLY